MRARLLMIAGIAACAARLAGAQAPASTIGGATVPPAVRNTIEAAGKALGMQFKGTGDSIGTDNIGTAEFWGSGTVGGAPVTDVHGSIDYSAPKGMRLEYVKNGQKAIEVVSIDANERTRFSWNESEPGGGTATPAPNALDDRQIRLWTLTPQAVVKAAVNWIGDAKVTKTATGTVLRYSFANAACRDAESFRTSNPCSNSLGQRWSQVKLDFTVNMDPKNMIQKVTTRAGTAVTETTFSDYKDFSETKSGKLFPGHITQKKGTNTLLDLTITKADLDYPPVVVITPQSLRDELAKSATAAPAGR